MTARVTEFDAPCSPDPSITEAVERLPEARRVENTRGGLVVELDDGISYRKWCVLCGGRFETVNKARMACGACQRRIFAEDRRMRRHMRGGFYGGQYD